MQSYYILCSGAPRRHPYKFLHWVPIMRLLHDKGLTHAQIGRKLGFTKDQVKQALARDRRKRRAIAQGHVPLPWGRPPGPSIRRKVFTTPTGVVVVEREKENTP